MEHTTNFEITGILNMSGNRIEGLAPVPDEPSEAVSKSYVDQLKKEIESRLPDLLDNGNF